MTVANEATRRAMSELATEDARLKQLRQMQGETGERCHIVQCLRFTDAQAINTFARFKIKTYYPKRLEMKPVPKRHLSRAQRASGLVVQKLQPAALFPRYLFVYVDIGRRDLDEIFTFAGVGGLVCTRHNKDQRAVPVYMPDEIIASIKRRENNGMVQGETLRAVFSPGDQVRVTNGPFASFTGIVETALDVDIGRLEPSTRIKVAIEMFGRATPVELEHWQVAKDD